MGRLPDGWRELGPLFQAPHEPVREYVYGEIGAARSIKTKTHSYIALRYTREQVAGVQERQRARNSSR